MHAELLTIGDELLIGQVVNTNAAWLGEKLDAVGISVSRVVTLGDEAPAIQAALEEAFSRADLVIVTGGLGPTRDDVTLNAVAAWLGVRLRLDEDLLARVQARFDRHGVPMPERNRSQAMVPEGVEPIPNPVGTAPGLWYANRGRVLVVLPGVPFEMQTLMEQTILPRLGALAGRRFIMHRTLLTAGVGESSLEDMLGDLSTVLDENLRLASLPGTGGVRLRLSATGTDRDAVAARLREGEAYLRQRLGSTVFGTADETLEAVLGSLLRAGEKTIAVAESCTGGLILHRLTNVSGASAYVVGGVVAYSNAAKVDLLGVARETLARDGAVSEDVARQMARGVRIRLGADVGLATTGIMGPTGGTPGKPVGTVWVGYADGAGEQAQVFRFSHPREINKERAATAALNLARLQLLSAQV